MSPLAPDLIIQRISKHISSTSRSVAKVWLSAEDDEDTITGHFCGQLQKSWSKSIDADGKHWRWRIKYKKFRGRGSGAFETQAGADGLIQVEIQDRDSDTIQSKGMLFQSKKRKLAHGKAIIAQASNMERLAPQGSAIFVYGPERFRAVASGDFLKGGDGMSPSQPRELEEIGHFLGGSFLGCIVGMRGLYYDAMHNRLIIPNSDGSISHYRFDLGHRVRIEIHASS